jgi:hypothetical protein
VTGWSLRKARLFTQDHVRIAAQRLAEHGLLPRDPTGADERGADSAPLLVTIPGGSQTAQSD